MLKKQIEAKENTTSPQGGDYQRVNYADLNNRLINNNSTNEKTSITMLREELKKEEDALQKLKIDYQKQKDKHNKIGTNLGPTSTLQFQ